MVSLSNLPGVALRADELERIAQQLGREPSRVEIYAFDAQWSEHCSYKSSRHHLRMLPVEGPTVMQGPAEDAGILHLGIWNGERYGVVIAHESHNHPSQVVPYEGAATGVGGIVRDVLCMGAEVIALADGLRFGSVEGQTHARYVAQGVVEGIAAYGNAIGVPNIAGDVHFDAGFDENCLVNVVALGLVKESEIIHSAAPADSAGYDIVLVGKATDASGFGGASFSSVTLDHGDADANRGAVQVPDPFLKNVIMRATYRVFEHLREHRIPAGFKDLGAGGVMGCSAELCASGGFGAIVDLDDVNVAVPGLLPEVIAIGETQERLCWILPGSATPEVLRIYNEEFSLPAIAHGARACVIGCVQKEKRYVLRHQGEIVADLPIDLLTGSIRDDLPVRERGERSADLPAQRYLNAAAPLRDLLPLVLSNREVCSREPLYERYDSAVRGCTVIPRGIASAGVIAPIEGAPCGVALSIAGNPRVGRLDSFAAAQHAVLQSVLDVVSVGARPLGLTDCLNFGNPQNIDHYSDLVAAIEGLAMAARGLKTPYVSGNVSLYNESKSGSAIPASPIVACVGVIDDLERVVTPSLKKAGAALYLLGKRVNACGGSVVAELLGQTGGPVSAIDFDGAREVIAVFAKARDAGTLRSARSIGSGGLLVALLQMAFCTERIGFELLDPQQWAAPAGTLEALFGEAGGIVAEVADAPAFERIAGAAGAVRIGTTLAHRQLVFGNERFNLDELRAAWTAPLREVYA